MLLIAVLGTGSIGSRHLSVLKELPDVKPIAIPVRRSRRAPLVKEGYTVVTDLAQAAQQGCWLAIIATQTSRHGRDAREALKYGFSLLMEKPLARDAQEARVIYHSAKRKKRFLSVGCCLRFSRSLQKFKQLLPRIGEAHSIRIECQSYLPLWRPGRNYRSSYAARANEGGVLRDLIHEIDYAGWLFGWPARLQASLVNTGRLNIQAEEMADVQWRHGSSRVSIHLDYLTRPSRRGITAMGERGTLSWNALEQTVTLSLPEKRDLIFNEKEPYNAMYKRQTEAFIQAARGKKSDLASGLEGIKALAICDAARKSSRTHREIKINYGV